MGDLHGVVDVRDDRQARWSDQMSARLDFARLGRREHRTNCQARAIGCRRRDRNAGLRPGMAIGLRRRQGHPNSRHVDDDCPAALVVGEQQVHPRVEIRSARRRDVETVAELQELGDRSTSQLAVLGHVDPGMERHHPLATILAPVRGGRQQHQRFAGPERRDFDSRHLPDRRRERGRGDGCGAGEQTTTSEVGHGVLPQRNFSLLTGKRTGKFCIRAPEPISSPSRPEKSVPRSKTPYAMKQGIFGKEQEIFARIVRVSNLSSAVIRFGHSRRRT